LQRDLLVYTIACPPCLALIFYDFAMRDPSYIQAARSEKADETTSYRYSELKLAIISISSKLKPIISN